MFGFSLALKFSKLVESVEGLLGVVFPASIFPDLEVASLDGSLRKLGSVLELCNAVLPAGVGNGVY